MTAAKDARPSATFCATYYAPVVSFLRREGRGEDEARELAHEFFARVLQGKSFGGANPHRGDSDRTCLSIETSFSRTVREQTSCAKKRGAGATHVPLSLETSLESTISAESPVGAEMAFDRDWGDERAGTCAQQVENGIPQNGAGAEYETLKGWLTGRRPRGRKPKPRTASG
jgi:RNA polymerase sigma-70 factor (ECF subfamily)